MRPTIGQLAGLLAVFGLPADAQAPSCMSSGLDYTNGGSYNVDSTSNLKFSFTSVFQGCTQESIEPTLISPTGDEYVCSAISTTPAGKEQKSECGIPYAAMKSGKWTIVLQGNGISTQRVITIAVVKPETTTVTYTPTVVIGVTSTPAATTVSTTLTQVASLVLQASSVTAVCTNKKTTTVLTTDKPVTVLSTAVRTSTAGATTVVTTTTAVATAVCHSANAAPAQTTDQPFIGPPWLRPGATVTPPAGGPPWRGGRGGRGGFPGRGRGRGRRSLLDHAAGGRDAVAAAPAAAEWKVEKKRVEPAKVEEREAAAVAATTTTVTATTTLTSTLTSLAKAATKTETQYKQSTVTVTPAPLTICEGGNGPVTVTAKAPGSPQTQSSVVYVTTTVQATVNRATTVQSTSYDQAKATACWASGGWYGA